MVEYIGATFLATRLAHYCMFFREMNVDNALGTTMIFWSIFLMRSLLNGTPKKSGLPVETLLLIVVIGLLDGFTAFSKVNWALTYFKGVDIIYGALLRLIYFLISFFLTNTPPMLAESLPRSCMHFGLRSLSFMTPDLLL